MHEVHLQLPADMTFAHIGGGKNRCRRKPFVKDLLPTNQRNQGMLGNQAQPDFGCNGVSVEVLSFYTVIDLAIQID